MNAVASGFHRARVLWLLIDSVRQRKMIPRGLKKYHMNSHALAARRRSLIRLHIDPPALACFARACGWIPCTLIFFRKGFIVRVQ